MSAGAKKVCGKVFAQYFLTNLGELSEQLHVQISIQYLLSIQCSRRRRRGRLSGIDWSKCGAVVRSGEEQRGLRRGGFGMKRNANEKYSGRQQGDAADDGRAAAAAEAGVEAEAAEA